MLNRLKGMLSNIDPLVAVGLGIGLLTFGLNSFADTLRALQEQAESTMASLTEASMMGNTNLLADVPAETGNAE